MERCDGAVRVVASSWRVAVKLLHQATTPVIIEHKARDVGIARQQRVGDATSSGEGVEIGEVLFEALLICLGDVAGERDFAGAAGFDVGEAEVAERGGLAGGVGLMQWVEFAGGECLREGDIPSDGDHLTEEREAIAVAFGDEQIGEQDEHATA